MAKITLKCTWCQQRYTAQRKSSQYCGGTCRQKANRLRRKTRTSGPAFGGVDYFAKWTDAETRYRNGCERLDELTDRWRRELNNVVSDNRDLLTEVVNLKTQLARRDDGGTVAPDQWERLANMDDKQLRQWVVAGRALARKGHGSPVENAIRWVEENRLQAIGE